MGAFDAVAFVGLEALSGVLDWVAFGTTLFKGCEGRTCFAACIKLVEEKNRGC